MVLFRNRYYAKNVVSFLLETGQVRKMLKSVALILLTIITLISLIKEKDIAVPKFLQFTIASLNFLIIGFAFYKYYSWAKICIFANIVFSEIAVYLYDYTLHSKHFKIFFYTNRILLMLLIWYLLNQN